MIDTSTLPSWDFIADRIGVRRWKHGRGQCPKCDSRTGFSCHEDKGFYCFACGRHGDKISFIMQYLNYNFKDALRFFGLEPGKPPAPDPAIERRRKARVGLQRWAKPTARELRDEHYIRERVIAAARRRLERDQEDEYAWNWLAWAYTGLEAIASKLDMLQGNEMEQIELYKSMRTRRDDPCSETYR